MANLETDVTGIAVCSRCLELATELVAVKHELHEAQKRHMESLLRIEAMLDQQLEKSEGK